MAPVRRAASSTVTPWYFRAEANEVKRDGISVLAGSKGTSPGNGFVDLPTPIDYTTMNYSAEGGYASQPYTANIFYLLATYKFQ